MTKDMIIALLVSVGFLCLNGYLYFKFLIDFFSPLAGFAYGISVGIVTKRLGISILLNSSLQSSNKHE